MAESSLWGERSYAVYLLNPTAKGEEQVLYSLSPHPKSDKLKGVVLALMGIMQVVAGEPIRVASFHPSGNTKTVKAVCGTVPGHEDISLVLVLPAHNVPDSSLLRLEHAVLLLSRFMLGDVVKGLLTDSASKATLVQALTDFFHRLFSRIFSSPVLPLCLFPTATRSVHIEPTLRASLSERLSALRVSSASSDQFTAGRASLCDSACLLFGGGVAVSDMKADFQTHLGRYLWWSGALDALILHRTDDSMGTSTLPDDGVMWVELPDVDSPGQDRRRVLLVVAHPELHVAVCLLLVPRPVPRGEVGNPSNAVAPDSCDPFYISRARAFIRKLQDDGLLQCLHESLCGGSCSGFKGDGANGGGSLGATDTNAVFHFGMGFGSSCVMNGSQGYAPATGSTVMSPSLVDCPPALRTLFINTASHIQSRLHLLRDTASSAPSCPFPDVDKTSHSRSNECASNDELNSLRAHPGLPADSSEWSYESVYEQDGGQSGAIIDADQSRVEASTSGSTGRRAHVALHQQPACESPFAVNRLLGRCPPPYEMRMRNRCCSGSRLAQGDSVEATCRPSPFTSPEVINLQGPHQPEMNEAVDYEVVGRLSVDTETYLLWRTWPGRVVDVDLAVRHVWFGAAM